MIGSIPGVGSGASMTDAVKPGGVMGKDEFLQLLVAQLKHQDPMNPMDSQAFAAQLAQFSSVEQLIQINETLQGQDGMNAAVVNIMNASSALGVLGRDVLAAGDTVDITGEAGQSVTVGLGGEVGEGILKIFDENGKEVGQRELGPMRAGRQEIELGDAAKDLEPGRYKYVVEVKDAAGDPVQLQTFSRIRIDGVRYGPGGPVLVSGTLEIPLSDVVEVITRD